jgi:hypothetical protein
MFVKIFKNVIKKKYIYIYILYVYAPGATFGQHIINETTELCTLSIVLLKMSLLLLILVLCDVCSVAHCVCRSPDRLFLVWINRLVHERPGQWALLKPWITSLPETDEPGRQLCCSPLSFPISGFEGLNPVRRPSHRTGWSRGNSGHAWFQSRPGRQLSQIRSPYRHIPR